MDTQLLQAVRKARALEIDFIGDLACPWSYIGLRDLERALDSLQGTPVRRLRWHGLPLAGMVPVTWREHLSTRLAAGTSVDEAQARLQVAGQEVGIAFDFERIALLPDTREANRLVQLAAESGRQGELVAAIFRAFFEQGRDIADPALLLSLAGEQQFQPAMLRAFQETAAGRDGVIAEERRLRGLGVEGVPNLLLNGRVMVPGAGDVSTYIQAVDQAIFPELPAVERRQLLH